MNFHIIHICTVVVDVQIAGVAAICWVIWKLRNQKLVFKVSWSGFLWSWFVLLVFLKYWTGPPRWQQQQMLRYGAEALQQSATGEEGGRGFIQEQFVSNYSSVALWWTREEADGWRWELSLGGELLVFIQLLMMLILVLWSWSLMTIVLIVRLGEVSLLLE